MLKTFPARVRKDGSLSLPKTARERLGLKPGDTLCLRGGTYYEAVTVAVHGCCGEPS